MNPDRSFSLVLLCFFLSGLAALMYETAWTREFAFVFGTSELAVATVLAAYMAGLAAGAAIAGRYVRRIRRPVLVYGVLELGIALAALAVPLAIAASKLLYVFLFGGSGAPPGSGGLGTALFYLACSFAILMVPTAMMGATLPLLASHAVRREDQIGSRIGLLYAVNTAGAVAGTCIAAFLLLPALGLRNTIYVAALVNGLVFLAAWALSRISTPGPSAMPEAAKVVASGRVRLILPLILLSGAISFSYEVLWFRLLGHVIGGSVYAFATMLASFLAGIALGGGVASRFARSREGASLGFAICQIAIGGFSLAAFAGVSWLPELAVWIEQTGAARLAIDVSLSALTLFPAAVFIGMTYPFAVRVLATDEAEAGPASARVYAFNTVGSIIGSIASGFFVIPLLGFEGTLTACVAINLVLAGVTIVTFHPQRRMLAAVAFLALIGLALVRPQTPWRILRSSYFQPAAAEGKVEYFSVGRSATVLLLERSASWFLRTNGLPESNIQPPGVWSNSGVARWLGALPALARPDGRQILIVGLGGGLAVESVPSTFEVVDVIELEPEVVEANRAVGDRRRKDPLSDPRVRVHVNDARNALLLSGTRFDAIVSQPSHPWTAGASHLYTREFFELAKSRLTDDGVFIQWIGMSFVDEDLFRSLLATLSGTFAHVRVYTPPPGGGLLFLSSDEPLPVEATAGRALAADPETFRFLGLETVDDVTAALVLDEETARRVAEGAPLNIDDHNRLMSRSPRLRGKGLQARREEFFGPLDPLVGENAPPHDRFYVLRASHPARAARLAQEFDSEVDRQVAMALIYLGSQENQKARTLLERALEDDPRHREARAAMLRLLQRDIGGGADPLDDLPAPLTPAELAVTTAWRAAGRSDVAGMRALEPELAAIEPTHPLRPYALRIRVEWRARSGDPALAAEAVELTNVLLYRRPTIADVLARARAAAAANDTRSALSALLQLGQRMKGSGRSVPLARGALRVLEGLPHDEQNAVLRNRVRNLLTGRLEGRPQGARGRQRSGLQNPETPETEALQ